MELKGKTVTNGDRTRTKQQYRENEEELVSAPTLPIEPILNAHGTSYSMLGHGMGDAVPVTVTAPEKDSTREALEHISVEM